MASKKDDHSDNSDSSDDYSYDNDDLITFRFESQSINVSYSQLSKYSKLIRDKYLYSDVLNSFLQEFYNYQEKNKIDSESALFFFQLLQQNFKIKKNFVLTYNQCIDLFKISDFLQVRKLTKKLHKYVKNNESNSDFIIQIMLSEAKKQKNDDDNEYCQLKVNQQMEDLLSEKVNDCFQNKKFADLPIFLIYRVVDKCDKKQMSNDMLYDFIKKSITKFCTLFNFLDIQNLSEERILDLCQSFANSDESERKNFGYLKCNLELILKLVKDKRNFQSRISGLETEKMQLQSNLTKVETDKKQIQDNLAKSETEKKQMQDNLTKLETEKKQMQDNLTKVETEKNQIQDNLTKLETEKKQIQNNLTKVETEKNQIQELFEQAKKSNDELSKENSSLKKRLAEIEEENECKVNGIVTARVKNGLLFNARIKLQEKNSPIDKVNSKYIVSTSNAKFLGESAYKNGQPITSLDLETICFGGKAGTYYVRALVFDTKGKSVEIVSNPVTTSGSFIAFDYEGKAEKVALIEGKYKLEVWGAQGGDGAGTRSSSNAPGKGGLGGYSSGSLTLSDVSNMYVYVGGKGVTATPSDGVITKGGFPDGGDTKTGLRESYTSVPGTGGGSTSIRALSDTLFTRLIVAGGGGGASGDSGNTQSGGCGGGQSGENCYGNHGAGTQVGSTPGDGYGTSSSAGVFGHGAISGYRAGSNSGGGGGGGWYGGGSGGHGNNNWCTGGGGGSGWVLTSSSLSAWQSGDPSNSSQFSLSSQFYLSNAVTIPGNSEFPSTNGGKETGHRGNGFAKITPE